MKPLFSFDTSNYRRSLSQSRCPISRNMMNITPEIMKVMLTITINIIAKKAGNVDVDPLRTQGRRGLQRLVSGG
jgi:hypothetical protein